MKKPKLFHHSSQCWEIKWLNVENESHGKTYFDRKEIHIFTLNKDEATLRDTLLHELLHVASEDVFDIVDKVSDVEDMEEFAVRLITPRLMRMFTSNNELAGYIFGGEK